MSRENFFGNTKKGIRTNLYSLVNKQGMKIGVTDYGATIVSLLVPDKTGNSIDIIRGFDNVNGYEETYTYMGATIGRHAGQIKQGTFELNGKKHKLVINDNDHNLHGGPDGFDKQLFGLEEHAKNKLVLLYHSEDGECGFPGNLTVRVIYTLSDKNELTIDFDANCDADTILSMTNHAYFNLNGLNSDSALNHMLKIYAEEYTEVDNQGLPTGNIFAVKNTPFDFKDFCAIGEKIDSTHIELQYCKGYDHNWIILNEKPREALQPICELKSPETFIHMKVYSNQPGLQMYSGNYLDGLEKGKNGMIHYPRSSICLEPQIFPNGFHVSHFPSPVLKKGETYSYRSLYKFTTY
jgi:aldose 1-epimerase